MKGNKRDGKLMGKQREGINGKMRRERREIKEGKARIGNTSKGDVKGNNRDGNLMGKRREGNDGKIEKREET